MPSSTNTNYAGFGFRLLAYLIDTVIIMVVNFILGMILSVIAKDVANLAGWVISLGIGIAYYIYFWTKDGQTPGKKVFNLKVQKVDGSKLDVISALLRYVGYFVSGLCLGIGFLWIIWDPKKQGWADKIAGTVVVTTK